jgi:MSHA biogenesis protein MshP
MSARQPVVHHPRGGVGAQSGFALPTAIFLLVVLAALAAWMVTLSRTTAADAALDLQGTRAYFAARAGIEWGAWQVLRSAAPAPCFASPASITLGADLANFAVRVTCTFSDHTDGATALRVYRIVATASSGAPGSIDYVERQVIADFVSGTP